MKPALNNFPKGKKEQESRGGVEALHHFEKVDSMPPSETSP